MQLIPEGPDIPEELINAHADGRVVFFCGAGISVGAGYPLFWKLVDELKKENPIGHTPQLDKAIEDNDLDFALTVLQKKIGLNSPRLRQGVARILTKKPRTLTNHRVLLRLAKSSGGTYRLVTTNFDQLFLKVAKEIKFKSFDSAPKLPIPRPDRWSSIVHLHGLIEDTSDPLKLNDLILTSADFGEAYVTDSYCSRFVVELFRHFTVVFIGYSLNDKVMRYLIDAISLSERLHKSENASEAHFHKPYAFVEHNENDKNEVLTVWDLKGVQPIPYFVEDQSRRKISGHRRLYESLESWAELSEGGQRERITTALNEAQKPYLEEDNFTQQRLLWALNDESGKAAEALFDVSEIGQTASIDWLPFFAKNGLLDQTYSADEWQRILDDHHGGAKEGGDKQEYRHTVSMFPRAANLKPTTRFLLYWMQWHLDKLELADWILDNGGVPHPDFCRFYNNRSKDEKFNIDLDTQQKLFWDLITSDAYRKAKVVTENNWIVLKSKYDFRDDALRTEFINYISPSIYVKKGGYRRYEEITKFLQNFDIGIQIKARSAGYIIGLIAESPEKYEGLYTLCEPMSSSILSAIEWMALFQKASRNADQFCYKIPSISPHPQNEHVMDIGNFIFLLSESFLSLMQHDKNSAIDMAIKWKNSGFPIFDRLFLFAANEIGQELNEISCTALTAEKGRVLWNTDTKREVKVYLREQAPQWNEGLLRDLFETLMAGPERTDYRNMSDDEWTNLRDHIITQHVKKVVQGGGSLPKEYEAQYNQLQKKHSHKLPEDQSDEFVIFSGGHEWVGERENIKSDDFILFKTKPNLEVINSWDAEKDCNYLKKATRENHLKGIAIANIAIEQEMKDSKFWSSIFRGLTDALEDHGQSQTVDDKEVTE